MPSYMESRLRGPDALAQAARGDSGVNLVS